MTEQQLSHYDAVSGSADSTELWRSEVQDRLAHYKRRRGRRIEGAYTMRFPFPAGEAVSEEAAEAPASTSMELPGPIAEPAPERNVASEVILAEPLDGQESPDAATAAPEFAATLEPGSIDLVLEPPEPVEEDDVPFVDHLVRPSPKRKVIAFPKHLSVAPEVVHRLADPVYEEAPRILDVPEELEAIPATPFLDGLQLDLPTPAEVAVQREHVELPYQPVKTGKRMLAGSVDLAVTGAASMVFAAVAYKLLNHPALGKFLVLGVFAGAVVLWVTYQYLFLVHAGKTLGMMATHIRLRTFKGKAPTMRQRRYRALSLYLSSLSVGMGLLWALVDVDGLCWHDRLSHTYLAH
jgi:uncharacterized RDD family membrane protein YckC